MANVAPLKLVSWRTPKLGQVCILACGHYFHHDPTNTDCAVTRHRCEKCHRGISADEPSRARPTDWRVLR